MVEPSAAHLDLDIRLEQRLWVDATEQLQLNIRSTLGLDDLAPLAIIPHPVLLVQAVGVVTDLVRVVPAQLTAPGGAAREPASKQ
jgi:hypothetical protein